MSTQAPRDCFERNLRFAQTLSCQSPRIKTRRDPAFANRASTRGPLAIRHHLLFLLAVSVSLIVFEQQ